MNGILSKKQYSYYAYLLPVAVSVYICLQCASTPKTLEGGSAVMGGTQRRERLGWVCTFTHRAIKTEQRELASVPHDLATKIVRYKAKCVS